MHTNKWKLHKMKLCQSDWMAEVHLVLHLLRGLNCAYQVHFLIKENLINKFERNNMIKRKHFIVYDKLQLCIYNGF